MRLIVCLVLLLAILVSPATAFGTFVVVDNVTSTGADFVVTRIGNDPSPADTRIQVEIRQGSWDGTLVWRTDAVSFALGRATVAVDGWPLLAGQRYVAGATSNSSDYESTVFSEFTLDAATVPVFPVLGNQFDQLKRNPFDVSALLGQLPTVYGNAMGGGQLGLSIFVALCMMFVLVALWLRQQDVTLPLIVGLIFGGWLVVVIPPEFAQVAYALTVLAAVGLFVKVFRDRYM